MTNEAAGSSTPTAAEGTETAATTASTEGTTATAQPGTEGEGTTTATDTDAGKNGEGGEQPQVPETYEAFTLPENFALEGDDLNDAHALFKELGLTQESAQKVIDKYIGKIDTLQKSIADAQQSAIEQQREEWGQQSVKEFGDGYQAMVQRAGVLIEQLAAERPTLRDTFNLTGHGNHPDYVWLVARVAELATTGSKVDGLGGETATAQKRSDGDAMYSQAVDMRKKRD